MNLHEYQAKMLFTEYGIPVPAGKPVHSIKEALRYASDLGGDGWVVKAQVHAGGRGKAGGVKLTRSKDELASCVRGLIGSKLITRQSAPSGQPVNCVLIQTISDIDTELYLGMVVDRSSRRIAVMASSAGGMDIEEVAATTPEKIFTITVNPVTGLQDYQARRIGFALGLNDDQRRQLIHILHGLYRLFIEKDLSLVEINPLVITRAGNLEALDAKVAIDDNALFRQTTLEGWRDQTQEDEKESIARRYDLNYVTLDGNIACMVNGAGLAMATMDIIKFNGGKPANFLDIGGGAGSDKVAAALRIILSDPGVHAILFNIFGGITRCDEVARGILAALESVETRVPMVVRLVGTNEAEGRRLLAGAKMETAATLSEAARKAVELAAQHAA